MESKAASTTAEESIEATRVAAAQASRNMGKIKRLTTDMKATFKEGGFKGVWKRYGWKVVVGIFVYYLVRDSVLYILIPWMIAKHFISSA